MVRGTNDIIRWFEGTNLPYWAIYSHKGIASGNRISQSNQEEGRTHGDALDELKSKIKVFSRGMFTLVASPTGEKLPTKGYMFTEIEITSDAPQTAVQGINGPPALSNEEIQAQISAGIKSALDAYKQEQEIKDLKAKLSESEKARRELEKSSNDPINKIIGAIAPYSDKIIAGIFPGSAAQVAGIPTPDNGPEENHENTTAMQDTAQTTELNGVQLELVSSFITTLAANDTDWENTLQRLTKKIEENPSMISMVKNFI